MKNVFGKAPEVLTNYDLYSEIDTIENGIEDCNKQHLPIQQEALDRLKLLKDEKRSRNAKLAEADKAREDKLMEVARAKVEAAEKARLKKLQESDPHQFFMVNLASLGVGER